MSPTNRRQSRASEVAFGQAAEMRILQRWMAAADLEGCRVVPSEGYDDYDFLILAKSGLPIAYVEIKHRRTNFSEYRDSICPVRKHHLALELWRHHKIPFLMVTEHPDALVEVDLVQPPTSTKPLGRRDRPGEKPPMHAFYGEDKITVLLEEEAA